MNEADDELRERVVPIVEEELVAGRQVVTTGSVRVQKHVDRHVKKVEMPVARDTVEVRRVPVNRVVETAPATRTVGDTTIIPVVEEELVVTKRLVLKEEIHLTRKHTRANETREVTLEKERAEVVRLDAEGRVVDEAEHTEPEFTIGRRRSILGE